MPKKLLALMLSIIAMFAIVDLARSAKTQLAQAFGSSGTSVTTANASEPLPIEPLRTTSAGVAKAGIMPATWDGSATR